MDLLGVVLTGLAGPHQLSCVVERRRPVESTAECLADEWCPQSLSCMSASSSFPCSLEMQRSETSFGRFLYNAPSWMQYTVACRATRFASSSFSGRVPCIRYSLNSLVQHPSWGSRAKSRRAPEDGPQAGAPAVGGCGSSSRGCAVLESGGVADGLKSRSSKTSGSWGCRLDALLAMLSASLSVPGARATTPSLGTASLSCALPRGMPPSVNPSACIPFWRS